jgi:cytochrome c oxidase subunit II
MYSITSISSGEVDRVFLFILLISVILLLAITFCMIYFVIKYDRKKNPRATQIEGNTTLEIIWSVIPTILVLIMFYYGWIGFDVLRNVPKDAMVVKVIGRMWDWKFIYENGKETKLLNVPEGRPVKLLMTSRDVVHSFFIPAFRIKEDVVPGMETYLWFQVNERGSYDILCTEYCGTGHSEMLSRVVVMPEKEFKVWYSKKIEEVAKDSPGLKLIKEKNCMACHSLDGTSRQGPCLSGIFGTKVKVITQGKERDIVVDDEYLRRSLLDPQADIVAGYNKVIMPCQKDILKDKEVEDIITYLKELK